MSSRERKFGQINHAMRPSPGSMAGGHLLGKPPLVALDRFGQQIESGHLVMFHPSEDPIFEVVDVRPVLNPAVPQGQQAVNITLRAQFPLQALAGIPCRGLAICGLSQERQMAEAKAAAERNGSAIELTDLDPVQPESPADQPEDEPSEREKAAFDQSQPEAGICSACGQPGPVGDMCPCGDSIFQKANA